MRSFSKRLCIIPARGGSKRIPNKNMVQIAGKPLLQYAIEVAVESSLFQRICVTSDDNQALELAHKFGVHSHQRSAALSSDTAQLKEVCGALLGEMSEEQFDAFCLLLPGHPLRTASDIISSYGILEREDVDSVLSAVPFSHPPQRSFRLNSGMLEPTFGAESFKRTQDLEPLFRHDGAVAWSVVSSFLKLRSLVSGRVAAYQIPLERSVDIDQPIDLKWAEFLVKSSMNP